MVKEKQLKAPDEEVTNLNLETLEEVSPEDKAKQEDYEKRMESFMKGFERLQKRHNIKLIQAPARIIYYDNKTYEEENTKESTKKDTKK